MLFSRYIWFWMAYKYRATCAVSHDDTCWPLRRRADFRLHDSNDAGAFTRSWMWFRACETDYATRAAARRTLSSPAAAASRTAAAYYP